MIPKERILHFVSAYQYPCPDPIEMEIQEEGKDYAVLLCLRSCKEKKHSFSMPLIYLKKDEQLLVGNYYGIKKDALQKEAIEAFLEEIFHTKVSLKPLENKGFLQLYQWAEETGYGKVFHKVYQIHVTHLLIGEAYPLEGDIHKVRLKAIPWDKLPSVGNPSAPHKLAVFLDMACPMCAKVEKKILEKIKKSKDIYGVFIQFPLVHIHPWAFRAAGAGMCFYHIDPSLYWQFLERVFQNQETMGVSEIDREAITLADQLQHRADFLSCYLKDENLKEVLSQLQLAIDLNIRGTPTLIWDGKWVLYSDWLK